MGLAQARNYYILGGGLIKGNKFYPENIILLHWGQELDLPLTLLKMSSAVGLPPSYLN